ncbi:MAG: glycosyltransferase family 9 protein [Roseburia sp.]
MKIKLIINRALITVSSLLSYLFEKKVNDCKTVLIVFQQVFGDSIIVQRTLKEYLKIYSPNDGYTVKMILRPSVHKFMMETMELPQEILYEDVDFKLFLESYKYYREIVNKYKNHISILIVPGTSFSAEVFSVSSNASRKIGLNRPVRVSKPFIMSLFNRLAYTEEIFPQADDMMIQRHRLLINYLGDADYKGQVSSLLNQDKIIEEEKYCVVCPGASSIVKCWPTKKYAEIIDYIYETYHLNTHLCGGLGEEKYVSEIQEFVVNKNCICSHVGNTTYNEWSSIVQHSEIVIGNDSATLHLAVAANRKAICIAGVYDKYQFFPYKVDQLNEGQRLPLTIIVDMPCEYCRTVGYFAGSKNDACKKRIEQGKCALCIESIPVESVIKKVDQLLKEDCDEEYK